MHKHNKTHLENVLQRTMRSNHQNINSKNSKKNDEKNSIWYGVPWRKKNYARKHVVTMYVGCLVECSASVLLMQDSVLKGVLNSRNSLIVILSKRIFLINIILKPKMRKENQSINFIFIKNHLNDRLRLGQFPSILNYSYK